MMEVQMGLREPEPIEAAPTGMLMMDHAGIGSGYGTVAWSV